VLVLAAGSGGAVAAGLVTSHDIRDGTVRAVDVKTDTLNSRTLRNGGIRGADLSDSLMARLRHPGPQGEPGPQGPEGPRGPEGDSYLADAYYSVAFYDVGDTNAGAIATVACKEQTDTAISGGVQVTGIGDTPDEISAANQRNTPVSSSFPGRMDWSTNSPKPERLDGWIVQFGGNAGQTSDKSPEKVKIWALCVPDLDIPVEQTFTESQ
jgi:hypothetical protein